MFLLRKRLFYLVLSILFCTFHSIYATEPKPNLEEDYILILNPDAETCAWSEMMIPHTKKVLEQRHPEYKVHVQYMYGLGMSSMDDVEGFKQQLFSDYSTPPKFLLLYEADIFGFLREDLEKHWPDVPVLLVAREEYVGPAENYLFRKSIPKDEQLLLTDLVNEKKNLTVVYNPFDIPGTLKIMKKMQPHVNKIFFITDERYISTRLRDDVAREIKNHYPEWELENLTPDKLTTDELIQGFLGIPKENGILYFTWFNNELTGNQDLILQTNAYRIFSLYVNNPIITVNDVGLKESGMLGGSYSRFEQVMETSLNAIDAMIKGDQKQRFVQVPLPIPTFNYMAMQNHGIDLSDVPANAYLYHRPLTFLEKNKDLILGLAIIIFLSILAIRITIVLKTRKMQDKEIKLLQKYGDLFTNMPIGYRQDRVLLDAQGKPVDFVVEELNPGIKEWFPAIDTFIGRKGSEVFEEGNEDMLAIYGDLLSKKKEKAVQPFHYKEADRYYSIIVSPASEYGYMDLFFVDMTELLKTQELLQTVNDKLSLALEIANVIPWKWHLQDNTIESDIRIIVGQSHDDLGIEKQEIIIPAEEYLQNIHADDRPRIEAAWVALVKEGALKAKEEYRVRRKDREGYDWVEGQAIVQKRDENGNPVTIMGSSLVITERKQFEEELRKAKDKAEESNRLKTAFLANMSHEIRTPLNAIVGFSHILAHTEDIEGRQEYINIIETNNELLLQLVGDILDLSKLEAGTVEYNYVDVDLNTLLEEQQKIYQDKVGKEVEVIFDEREPYCFVNVEKKLMTQALSNLLANATKFTDKGSIRFGYKIEEGMLRFHVTDTGRGISKERLNEIFHRFIKLDHFMQGAGLGLSLCQMIVNTMGGKVGVDSEEGVGSTFWFTFPYKTPMEAAG
ncbi:signal transduction histidine kinase [Parabacteroides sp. PFB2-12]|uniref:sensor histidine kinase n=1 Tax=unclassified Parabacteroides TaxID=2649774 RepID=UPI0024764C65|nr:MULTISPECIES: hybrid sensor histidine kinase/response regulator [unclassified Parabacteroides]MDH6342811.1 signal transduction histidine kinase [Parabacteroides sp. PM6-13]MDH6390559.1 signal transduction histidine kinase [Parabacteroides sp. PFB2-12]